MFVCFRCDIGCDAASVDIVYVCCVCVCVRCVRYICGVCEVFGDFVWYAFGCVFCCVCVCFDLGVRFVSDVLCDVCVVCVVRVCVCACGG